MKTYLFEAVQPEEGNWGKFLVCQLDEEFTWPSQLPSNDFHMPLLRQRGWSKKHLLVVDLETGEGAFFRHGGHARADLNKHRIWVCPMFEPFLTWLYEQDPRKLDELPQVVILDAPFKIAGYRRPGPKPDIEGRLMFAQEVAAVTGIHVQRINKMAEAGGELEQFVVDAPGGLPLFWRPGIKEWCEDNPDLTKHRPAWFRVISLMAGGQEHSPSDVAEDLEISMTAATQILSDLFLASYVNSRRESESKFSKTLYHITPHGQRMWDKHGNGLTLKILRAESQKIVDG